MEIAHSIYAGLSFSICRRCKSLDIRYAEDFGVSKVAKMFVLYDRQDPSPPTVISVGARMSWELARDCFSRRYAHCVVNLSQMLTFTVAIKSEATCELEFLLFAGMKDHPHSTELLEILRSKRCEKPFRHYLI